MNQLAILAEPDLDWVSAIVDVVEAYAGQPWRNALDRLDDLQRANQPASPRRFTSVVGAVQRLTGGRTRNTRAAREARGLVLGHPVFSAIERQARIVAAADMLAVTPASVETLLWSDLPRERPIELLYGRPSELEVAAFANVALIQRGLRRAQAVTLRVTDDAGPLLRAAAHRGLLATASLAGSMTVIEIVGPLSLFHRTSVYGRALAELVPLLGELKHFSLEIHVETPTSMYSTCITAPVLLPAPPPRLAAAPYPVVRLARQLQRLAPELRITQVPAPLSAGAAIVCPDLAIERGGRMCYVELVGFWTADYVERKQATYRGIGADVILCVDGGGACADAAVPAEALVYRKQVDAAAVLGRIKVG